MKTSEAFPSKYIKCADLQGRTIGVTIDHVTQEMIGMGADKDQKLIVYFRGKEKGLVCNRTNANMIEEIANTDETDDWRGVSIALKPAKVDFQGKRVDAIRVDYPSGNGTAPGRAPVPAEPFVQARGAVAPIPPEHQREPGDDDVPF